MPQLDPSSFPSQLFWLTLSFVILYMTLSHLLLPRVHSVLLTRKRTMEGDVEYAEKLKSEAARAEEQYEQSLKEARLKSQAMLSQARADIAASSSRHGGELDVSIEKKLAESDAAIRSAKQAVADKLSPVAGDLAALIVEALLHQKPDAQATANAVSEVSRERGL